jgi:hypothetical protein
MNYLRKFFVWFAVFLVIIFSNNCKEKPISDSNKEDYDFNEIVSDNHQDIKWKQDISWVSISESHWPSYAWYFIEQCEQANLPMENVKLINEYNDPNGIILLPDSCFEKLLFTDTRASLSLDYIDVWCCLETYNSDEAALTRYKSIKNTLDLSTYASDFCFQKGFRVLILNRRLSPEQASKYIEIFMAETDLDKYYHGIYRLR